MNQPPGPSFRRRLALTAALAMLLVLAVGCGGDQEDTGSTSVVEDASPESLLFVQRSEGARLERSGGSATLTLLEVEPVVREFSDRPFRDASTEPLEDFLARWNKAVAEDPPNAALIADELRNSVEVPIVELESPTYEPDARTLTYRVESIGGLPRLAGRLTNVTLFIDTFTEDEGGGGWQP